MIQKKTEKTKELLEDTNQNWQIVILVVFIIFVASYKVATKYSLFDFSIFLMIVPIMVALFFLMLIFYSFMKQHEI
ncbi:MAG: hypothetical protein KAQ92_02475 [Candidatus Aenigmarchaeota archaeon]|nr:hypothetical protein [Candidatus Aenigmarchaeota archaeon]MCK5476334.1 hypothetical protein [Candidatus Aenigmarchaeota archaeon]